MSNPKVFKAIHILNRGRKTEVQPGTLFEPGAKERDEFLALGAIEEASDAEIALFEKMGNKTIAPEVAEEAGDAADREARIAALVDENDRAALNTLAANAGVVDPDALPTKAAVAAAIVDASTDDLVG